MTTTPISSRWLLTLPEWLESILVGRWFPGVINVAAMLVVGIGMTQRGSHFLKPPVSTSQTAAVPADGERQVQTILDADLFGRAEIQGDIGQRPAGGFAGVNLRLALSGLIVTGTVSYALFSIDGTPDEPYRVGQVITSGVTLYAVFVDRAVVVRTDGLETIMLKDALAGPPPNSAVPRTAPTEQPLLVQREQMLAQLQRPEVLRQASIVPDAGGGFLVRSLYAGSVYETLGLRAGDVIRGVNGEPINSLSDALKLYAQLRSGGAVGAVSLELSRAGKTAFLKYYIQ